MDGRGGRRSPERQGGPGQGRTVALREDWFFLLLLLLFNPTPSAWHSRGAQYSLCHMLRV